MEHRVMEDFPTQETFHVACSDVSFLPQPHPHAQELLARAIVNSMNLPLFLSPCPSINGTFFIDGALTERGEAHRLLFKPRLHPNHRMRMYPSVSPLMTGRSHGLTHTRSRCRRSTRLLMSTRCRQRNTCRTLHAANPDTAPRRRGGAQAAVASLCGPRG